MGALYPLKRQLVRAANQVGRRFGLRVEEYNPEAAPRFDNWQFYARLLQTAFASNDTAVGNSLASRFVDYCVRNHRRSNSQLFQDLMVLVVLNEQRDGFFVEFGATDGVSLSNTCLLERAYQWTGILAEPGHVWHNAIFSNRSCAIDTRCVWRTSGERLEFNETDSAELSTLNTFSGGDQHSSTRQFGKIYSVETVSLIDLLRAHNAPAQIDYLSIDTEGSEFNILNGFDFDAYDIRIISVEHNHKTLDRDNIALLLTRAGFTRVLDAYSHFDDWYVKSDLLPRLDS